MRTIELEGCTPETEVTRIEFEYAPQPVSCWYMRDNHTFRALPLDVKAALVVMREELDAGQTYGMLCGGPYGVVPGPVHARTAMEWQSFEDAARPWLETAVARSKPPKATSRALDAMMDRQNWPGFVA